MIDLLLDLCARRGFPAHAAADRSAFLGELAAAGRRAGKRRLALDPDEAAHLAACGIDWPLAQRTDDLLRIAMIVRAADSPDLDFVALLGDCFSGGDNEERRAVLRALPLLPDQARFTSLAVEACRTNVVPVFEAIACENPFPARHFADASFNQMVLKTVFVGLPLARVIGVERRRGPELERMARDYASERRAAGRSVPDDLALLWSETRT
jgi:hypothetical protein